MLREEAMSQTGKTAATLSAMEVGLGALLHSFKVPLSGNFLSLNQGFFLSRASLKTGDPGTGARVSVVVSLLKSLAPAGKKLTPMLAISAQGFLFSLGSWLFGVNPLGLSLGMVLLCLWSFIQPVAIYYLLYGRALLDMGDYFLTKLEAAFSFEPSQLLWVLGTLITIKILIGLILVGFSFRVSDHTVEAYQSRLLQAGSLKRSKSLKKLDHGPLPLSQALLRALQDLLNPLFIGTFCLTAFYFIFVHSDQAPVVWILLRPLAVGYLLFLLIRVLPLENLFRKMEEGHFKALGQTCQSALSELKKMKS